MMVLYLQNCLLFMIPVESILKNMSCKYNIPIFITFFYFCIVNISIVFHEFNIHKTEIFEETSNEPIRVALYCKNITVPL